LSLLLNVECSVLCFENDAKNSRRVRLSWSEQSDAATDIYT
jgi:hypothetical protein